MGIKARCFASAESGSVAVVFALLLPVILGMCALGVDLSVWMMQQRKLQTAADAAALSATFDMVNGRSQYQAEDSGTRAAEDNGWVYNSSNTIDFTFSTDSNGRPSVKAALTEKLNTMFGALFTSVEPIAQASATAGEQSGGPYCFLSLDPSASQAIKTSGNVNIDTTCGVADNSNSSTAFYMNGNVDVTVGAVNLVGNYSDVGNVSFNYSSLTTNGRAVTDPYASLSIDSYTSCTPSQQAAGPTKFNGNGTHNISPGVYCGGISLSGNTTLNMAPGTYILDGGSFSGSGNLTITGQNVTIILTNSGGSSYGTYGNISLSGNVSTYLTAPTTGDYAGIVVYQDRDAPASSTGNTLTGNSSTEFTGVFYTPSRSLDYGGNTGFTASNCSKIIAKTITFHGNPSVGDSCSGLGTKDIGNGKVILTE